MELQLRALERGSWLSGAGVGQDEGQDVAGSANWIQLQPWKDIVAAEWRRRNVQEPKAQSSAFLL